MYKPPEFNFKDWQFNLTWKIHNFSVGLHFINEYFYSAPFTIPLTNDSFRLMLFKNCDAKDYLSLYLYFIPSKHKKENSYVLWLMLKSNNGKTIRFFDSEKCLKQFDYWGSKKFINWKLLMENKEMLLPKDILTIYCRITPELPARLISVYSLKKTLENLYIKEKRYPSEIKLKKMSRNDCQSRNLLTPEKNRPIPILHEWFKYLYSEKIDSSLFSCLESIIQNAKQIKLDNETDLPTALLFQSYLSREDAHLTWYIKRFRHLKQNEKFFSPVLRCGSNIFKFLFFLSTNNYGEEIVNIFVCPMSLYMNSKKIVKCKISVVAESGRLPLSKDFAHLYDNNGQWKLPTFIKTETLKKDKSYLSNDTLILFCSLSVFESRYKYDESWTVTEILNDESQSQYRLYRYFRQLSKDMLALLESGLHSDVTLKINQDEVNVHKSILSERSSEFKRRIKYLTKTSGNGKIVIEITDLDKKHLKELLEYMYGGVCRTYLSPCFILASLKYGIYGDFVINRFFFRQSMATPLFNECCKDLEKFKSLNSLMCVKEIPFHERVTYFQSVMGR